MNLKLIVASRLENLTPQGHRVNIVAMSQGATGQPLVKLEIGNLSEEGGKQFPLGRQFEITVPTYNNRGLILTPNGV